MQDWKRWVGRLLGSAVFGVLVYYAVAGFDPGNTLSGAFDNHGWDFSSWSFSPGQFISPLSPTIVQVVAAAAGVLLSVWGGFWDWVFGEW